MMLKKLEPMIRVHTLGDSSVNFAVCPWVKTEDYWNVYWGLTREVKMHFDREGISIPFPQQQCNRIADKINSRPRKRYGFKTPEEVRYGK